MLFQSLLRELEEFAFKGIPDVRGCRAQDAQLLHEVSEAEYNEKLTQQRHKQQELIQQLKSQLEDLETYAYEVSVNLETYAYKVSGSEETYAYEVSGSEETYAYKVSGSEDSRSTPARSVRT